MRNFQAILNSVDVINSNKFLLKKVRLSILSLLMRQRVLFILKKFRNNGGFYHRGPLVPVKVILKLALKSIHNKNNIAKEEKLIIQLFQDTQIKVMMGFLVTLLLERQSGMIRIFLILRIIMVVLFKGL